MRLELNSLFEDTANEEYFYDQSLEMIESSLENSWANICKIGEEKGFKTINILHPIIGTGDRILPKETEKFSNSEDVILINKLNLNYTNLESCNNIHDFRNVFSGMDDVVIYFDVGHMSDFGNEIIAEKIYEKILPIILDDV